MARSTHFRRWNDERARQLEIRRAPTEMFTAQVPASCCVCCDTIAVGETGLHKLGVGVAHLRCGERYWPAAS